MQATCIVLLALAGCVVFEADTGIPERDCGEEGTVPDDGRCHCHSDCRNYRHGAVCLSEYAHGYPGGVCTRLCDLDADCNTGFVCNELCLQVCTTSSDCVAGRMCRAKKEGLSVCDSVCDEDADCDNLTCNVYSGKCLLFGQRLHGAGLNAPCVADGDCRSDTCIGGACGTRCDMSSPHCPEGGVCVSGWCENACTASAGCAPHQSCAQTDAGSLCR